MMVEVITEEQETNHDYLLLNVDCPPHIGITLNSSGGKIA
jgi:hypothetical protein